MSLAESFAAYRADGSSRDVAQPAKRRGTLPPSKRRFLFLRGPFSPFFSRLADALRAQGSATFKVNFDSGDRINWGVFRPAIDYALPLDAFEGWLTEFIRREGVTDLICFNDCISPHDVAINVAKRLGVAVSVFEEGYFRPHWITLDDGGVNGFSGLPRDSAIYHAWPETDDGGAAAAIDVGKVTQALVGATLKHYAGKVFLAPISRKHDTPFAIPTAQQARGHLKRYGLNGLRKDHWRRVGQRLLDHPGELYLAVLQRTGDTQLTWHSAYTNESFIEGVVASFARHAPASAQLAVKLHPLEPGLVDYETLVARAAAENGVGPRVTFIDGGNLQALAKRSRGVVTVNSTAGLACVGFGCPTKVLGRAFYDIEGLTAQEPLDQFWTDATAPDLLLFERFRAYVMSHTQINGSYYTPKGLELAINGAVAKLLETQ